MGRSCIAPHPAGGGCLAAREREVPSSAATPPWAEWPDDRLLRLRFCDLGLRLEGTDVEPRLAQLRRELAARGLAFEPHAWLSDEWFCPDGVPGIAVPFYLAHPRLARLEQAQMLEVEGGTREWCLRILRHEAGHAIENAYRLRGRTERVLLFGSSTLPYPEHYVPRPYSRSYVVNLGDWYAQSHPDEDFAETFAVWLDPRSRWRDRYEDWPALRKLEYVDDLMSELRGAEPVVRTRRTVDPLPRLRQTLGTHYRRRRAHYEIDRPRVDDQDLLRLFAPPGAGRARAAPFVESVRSEARKRVARWTGLYRYTVDQVLKDIRDRCRALDLRLPAKEADLRPEFLVFLTAHTMSFRHTGRHRMPL